MSLMSRLTDYSNPNSLAARARTRRHVGLKRIIERIWVRKHNAMVWHNKDEPRVSIIDLGGEVNYWRGVGLDFLREMSVHITILNLNSHNIADNPDPALFTLAVGDCCDLSEYDDRHFDLAHSNSVIEHLSTFRRMKDFAAGVTRIANRQYHQTPSFWFPLEPHFLVPGFHWMPEPARAWLTMKMPLATFPRAQNLEQALGFVQDVHLLTMRQVRDLFPREEIRCERVAGLIKSYVITTREPKFTLNVRPSGPRSAEPASTQLHPVPVG